MIRILEFLAHSSQLPAGTFEHIVPTWSPHFLLFKVGDHKVDETDKQASTALCWVPGWNEATWTQHLAHTLHSLRIYPSELLG